MKKKRGDSPASAPDDQDDDIPKIGLAAKSAKAASAKAASAKAASDDVPHIGRGRSRMKIPVRQLFIIGMTLITLIVILVMRQSCAQGVGKAFNNLAPPPPDAGVTYIPLPGPPTIPGAQPTGPAQPTPQAQPPRPVPSTPGR